MIEDEVGCGAGRVGGAVGVLLRSVDVVLSVMGNYSQGFNSAMLRSLFFVRSLKLLGREWIARGGCLSEWGWVSLRRTL